MLPYAPAASSTVPTRKNGVQVGVRLDLNEQFEAEAFTYIEGMRAKGYTPRMVIVDALVARCRGLSSEHAEANDAGSDVSVELRAIRAMLEQLAGGYYVPQDTVAMPSTMGLEVSDDEATNQLLNFLSTV